MRPILRAALGGILVAAGAACSRYAVQTTASPEAQLTGFRTFTVLPAPQPRDRQAHRGSYDPMAANSVANRGLRDAVVSALESRGYTLDEQRPDFSVAMYANAQGTLDLSLWPYGYQQWPNWPDPRWPREQPRLYPAGSVVLDMVSPVGGELVLVWRGSGTAKVTEDEVQNAFALRKVAEAIAGRFPRASSRTIAAAR